MPELGTMQGENNCFKYNFALVSRIAASFESTSSFDLKPGPPIDIDKARSEHEELVETLRRIGLDVIELPCDEKHPDGLYVNDIAVVINGTALICNPPTFKDKPARQGELAVVRHVLRKELGLKIVEVDVENAYVEGGDVLWTGREIFVGISKRTNIAGAQAVAKAFPEYSTINIKIPDTLIHLQDVVTMTGNELMTVAKSPAAQKVFQQIKAAGGPGYRYIRVEEEEAANVIFCNKTMLHLAADQIPKGFAVYENKIDYPRVALSMQEPLKRGGRLASCVLLINRVRHPKKVPMSNPESTRSNTHS